MISRYILNILSCVVLAAAIACTSAEDRAAELYSIAQLEEKQFNPNHARKIYQDIIAQYPTTSIAQKASRRIKALEGEPP